MAVKYEEQSQNHLVASRSLSLVDSIELIAHVFNPSEKRKVRSVASFDGTIPRQGTVYIDEIKLYF